MSLALEAGVPIGEMWRMTAHQVVMAYNAGEQRLSRLAWRTAYLHRVQARHFPRTEQLMLGRGKAARKPRQTIEEQYRMARKITDMMRGAGARK